MTGLPRFLTHNWYLKLAALGLSIFLWALVQTEPLSQETFSAVPVHVEVADTAWTVAGDPEPRAVELRLGGPAREIIRLAREGTRVRVPIASVGSRDTVVTIQREWVDLGQQAGVTIESVSPPVVRVSFEQAVTRSVPVALRLSGALPEDLALSSELGLSPETVRVRGPVSRLAGLDSIPLEPFDLSRVQRSGAFSLAVDTSALPGVRAEPAQVALGVMVEPRVERILEDMRVDADPGPGGPPLRVTPATVELRLSGARSLVTSLDLSLVRVGVPPESLADMEPGEVRRVRLEVEGLPPLITAVPDTEVVTVRPVVGGTVGAARTLP
ncbi:MAG TPA: YbbR-like domain-containing protein [Longimicrobiales bacterium]|nr:YbbR-like domain-containing protein [Longimicrobiales bacterium]